MTTSAPKTRALLLDIEGTITPISFVHEVLFPFARHHVRDFLIAHAEETEVQKDIEALASEHSHDQKRGAQPPPLDNGIDELVAYVHWLIDRDRKSPALKSIQGKIWEQGYREGTLKAPLFDDVVPNLRRLRQKGLRTSIFSSGSVLAQKLLFAHTETGDQTDLIDEYFDTGVGSKVDPGSYRKIARCVDLPPKGILFVSDVTSELEAARDAGMSVFLCVRPGNQSQPDSEMFRVIHSFSDILPA